MLNWLFKGVGAVTRDVVELADSTYETAKEGGTGLIDEIASIPDALSEGYSEGLISNGDAGPQDPTQPQAKLENQSTEDGFPKSA